jgi:hypothetical protein
MASNFVEKVFENYIYSILSFFKYCDAGTEQYLEIHAA